MDGQRELAQAGRQCAALACTWSEDDQLLVCLVTSRDTGRWVLPKGWCETGCPAYFTAAQEAYEEAGLHGCVAEELLGTYAYEKRLRNGSLQTCIVEVYLLAVEREHNDWPERDERRRKWMTLEDAAEVVHESELRALLLGPGANVAAMFGPS